MPSLLSFPLGNFDSLKDSSRAKIIDGHANALKLFVCLCGTIYDRDKAIDFDAITKVQFDDFRMGKSVPAVVPPPVSPAALQTANATSAATTSLSKTSDVDLFRKGIKRDPTIYPTIKDLPSFLDWSQKVMTHAKSQGVAHVLDLDYKPNTPDEIELFKLQQDYMFSVFTNTIKFLDGETLVTAHAGNGDAQGLFKDLTALAKQSTEANLQKQALLQFLHNNRLNDAWKGTAKQYIILWMINLQKYEKLCKKEDERFTDFAKKEMLKTAVKGIDELAAVEMLETQALATGNAITTFSAYVELLKTTAVLRDDKFGLVKRQARRSINVHDLQCDQNGQFIDDGTYDVDDDIDPNQRGVFLTKVYDRPRIPDQTWKRLDYRSQLIIMGKTDPEIEAAIARRKMKDDAKTKFPSS